MINYVFAVDGAPLTNGIDHSTEPIKTATPPPTSKLVSRLFPNLKAQPTKQQKAEQVKAYFILIQLTLIAPFSSFSAHRKADQIINEMI